MLINFTAKLSKEFDPRKVRHFDRIGVSCQIRSPKNTSRGHALGRLNDDIRPLGQQDRGQLLTDSLRKGVLARDKDRHIGTQPEPQLHQRSATQACFPQPVQRQQRAGGVGTAAAHAGAPGHLLVDRDAGPQRTARGLLQGPGGAQAQVVGRQRRAQVVAKQLAVAPQFQVQRVGPVDQHEYRLEQVVAVGALFDADVVAGGDVRAAELFGAAEERAAAMREKDASVSGVGSAMLAAAWRQRHSAIDDATALMGWLRGIEKDKLGLALKGASPTMRDLFFSNMSERAGKILKDDMEALGPVRLKDVDEAQMKMVVVAKELAAKGEIMLSGGKAEDELVY